MEGFVLFKSVFLVDFKKNLLKECKVTDDLNAYFLRLVDRLNSNDKLQYFKTSDENRQVIKLVKDSVLDCINRKEHNSISEKSKSIANRLLVVENQKQKQVEKMKVEVKKGCLLQTIFYDNINDQYLYLLTKTENDQYMDDENFCIRNGFKVDSKNLWKSCVIQLLYDGKELKIGEIKVFRDNSAVYWHKEFLEIEPIRKDEQNTKTLFNSIDITLKQVVRPNSKHEYFVYRNSLLKYIRSHEQIDYESLLEDIFINYVPLTIDQDVQQKLVNKLMQLPEDRKFDRQFNRDLGGLNARIINKSFELIDGVDLIIKGSINEEDISSMCDNFGNKFIKIKTDNDEAYSTFLNK